MSAINIKIEEKESIILTSLLSKFLETQINLNSVKLELEKLNLLSKKESWEELRAIREHSKNRKKNRKDEGLIVKTKLGLEYKKFIKLIPKDVAKVISESTKYDIEIGNYPSLAKVELSKRFNIDFLFLMNCLRADRTYSYSEDRQSLEKDGNFASMKDIFNPKITDIESMAKRLNKTKYLSLSRDVLERCIIEKQKHVNTISVKRILLDLDRFEYLNIPYLVDKVNALLTRHLITNEKLNRLPIDKGTKKLLFERADGKCEICGKTEFLEMHHNNPGSNKGGNDLNNLKLLCRQCHRDFAKVNLHENTN